MPAPQVPPPASDSGALTYPRQLQRWLDVWPVTKLDRTESYITIPSFSIANTWNGYSTIIATYNFEGKNNFSLKYIVGEVSNPNYILCVMWIDTNSVTHRYMFWKGIGEVMPQELPLYTGQLVKKNFRLEVWNINSTTAVQTTAINVYTSVLGGLDYRYGNDFTLVNNDGQQTSFADGIQPSQGMPPMTGLVQWLRADQGVVTGVSGTWQGAFGVGFCVLNCTGTVTQSSTAGVLNGQQYIDLSTGSFTGSMLVSVMNFSNGGFVVIVLARSAAGSGTNAIFQVLNTATPQSTLNYNSTSSKLNSNSIDMSVTLPVGQWVAVNIDKTFVYQSSVVPYLFEGNITPSGTGSLNCTVLTLPSTATYIAEMLFYNNTAAPNTSQLLNLYLSQRYSSASMWALPLIFPAGSTPQPNT